jgi:hypothetical protein
MLLAAERPTPLPGIPDPERRLVAIMNQRDIRSSDGVSWGNLNASEVPTGNRRSR